MVNDDICFVQEQGGYRHGHKELGGLKWHEGAGLKETQEKYKG